MKRIVRGSLLTGFTALLFLVGLSAGAADKVVVIPMGGAAEGDATTDDVVAGKTFSSQEGKGLTGTLTMTGITEEVDPTVDASVKDGVTWSELGGIPPGFADGIDDTGGVATEVDPTVDASVKDGVTWSELGGVPAGFADGIDADSGGDITGVSPGDGLSGGGDSGTVTLHADPTYVQRRISKSCTSGSSIRAVAEDGSVTCEADSDSGGDITGVTAGTGISGGGSSGTITVSAKIPFALSANIGGGVIHGTNSRSGVVDPGYGVFGQATSGFGTGVYGYATATAGIGVKAESDGGDALYAKTNNSGYHAGNFTTSVGSGLSGAALYARTYNATGQGIALWAHNDHTASTDSTVIISNDGSGALIKGFGGNGGNDEFRIDNDGSLHITDPSINDDVFHMEAARGLLLLGSGSVAAPGDDGDIWITNSVGSTTISLDGNSGNFEAFNGSSNRTILIDPQESAEFPAAGGQITLFDPDGTASVEIDGDFAGHGNIKLYNNDHNLRVNLDGSDGYVAEFYGNVRLRDNAGATVMELGAGLDYAEGFNVSDKEKILSGSVLVIDPDNPGQLKLSESAYDTKVAGIVAGANGIGSGIRLGAEQFDRDVALAGRVYCNVDTTQTEIMVGDLLTTSYLPGYAMKAENYNQAQGAILGKAMQPLEKGKQGQILVLVTLQ